MRPRAIDGHVARSKYKKISMGFQVIEHEVACDIEGHVPHVTIFKRKEA